MSPVWAPEALAWQSCPPTRIAVSPAFHAIGAISVAGGQIRISQVAPLVAASSAAISARLAAVPFIFQFPAASFWRIDRSSEVGKCFPCQ